MKVSLLLAALLVFAAVPDAAAGGRSVRSVVWPLPRGTGSLPIMPRRLVLRGGASASRVRARASTDDKERPPSEDETPTKRARTARAGSDRGGSLEEGSEGEHTEQDMSSMDTAQVDEAYSLLGGSEGASAKVEEEVDYVNLGDDSDSSFDANGTAAQVHAGNRPVLQEFGENSIFAGITLYNDTIGCGRQRPARGNEGNTVLAASDSEEDVSNVNTSISFEIFDPLPPDAESIEPLLQVCVCVCMCFVTEKDNQGEMTSMYVHMHMHMYVCARTHTSFSVSLLCLSHPHPNPHTGAIGADQVPRVETSSRHHPAGRSSQSPAISLIVFWNVLCDFRELLQGKQVGAVQKLSNDTEALGVASVLDLGM
jgi:hypothetical protein